MEAAVILQKSEYDMIQKEIDELKREVKYLKENSGAVKLYTVAQAAEKLKCCKAIVRTLCHEGKLEFTQEGRTIKISVKSIDDHILKHTVKK